MTTIHHRGDIVVCRNGRGLYEITRDIKRTDRVQSDQFRSIHPDLKDPEFGDTIKPCPQCGNVWWVGCGKPKHITEQSTATD